MTVNGHWWWRPGWRVGRRMYTWHVTFASHPEVSELAARVQARLAGLPGLDLIPGQWLHLTMQGIGFTDDVPEDDITLIVEGARKHLAAVPVPRVTVGPARVVGKGIAFEVAPQDGLTVEGPLARGPAAFGPQRPLRRPRRFIPARETGARRGQPMPASSGPCTPMRAAARSRAAKIMSSVHNHAQWGDSQSPHLALGCR